jgi:hypothetical protein
VHPWIARALGLVAFAVGTILTWALLVPLFYGFFWPFGRLFRRGRRDALERAWDRDAPTWWRKHGGPEKKTLADYEKQY